MSDEWDALRYRVKDAAQARGGLAGVAAAIGYARSTLEVTLSMRARPSAAMQKALRAWLDLIPAPAPPSWDPSPAARMCAPPEKFSTAPDFVSQQLTVSSSSFSVNQQLTFPEAPAAPEQCTAPEHQAVRSAISEQETVGLSFPVLRFDPVAVVRWEHVVVRLADHDWAAQCLVLDERGAEGFELVCVAGGVAYMRRRVG